MFSRRRIAATEPDPSPYQISGRDVLFDWLARERNPDRRQSMLDWLAVNVREPLVGAHRVPGIAAPVYIWIVPLTPPVAVRFLLAEQYRTIRLIRMTTVP